jgi:hypothetical protein
LFLQNFLGSDIDEYGPDSYQKIADLLHKALKHCEDDFDKNKISYIDPYAENKKYTWG